jgi:hypothetical protein
MHGLGDNQREKDSGIGHLVTRSHFQELLSIVRVLVSCKPAVLAQRQKDREQTGKPF